MKIILIVVLKVLRNIYLKLFGIKKIAPVSNIVNPDIAAQNIMDLLLSCKPCMIARFGSTELSCISNYLSIQNNKKQYIKFIIGKIKPWWWDTTIVTQMQTWSGFFPPSINDIELFCKLMIKDISQVDLLGSWLPEELLFKEELAQCIKIDFELLNPYFSKIPWTKALEGKKILVVHPFAHTIEQQYKKRTLLFPDNLLPEFRLSTIKAVQTIAGTTSTFETWFEALEHMKNEIDKQDYDICLIGCGAYGFPLAAHVKRMGKKSVQLGGSLQLLFGIKGKRWEDENYNKEYNYARLINEHWVKPSSADRPQGASKVEGACYW